MGAARKRQIMADIPSILLASVAQEMTNIPVVITNRARAAAVVSKGYSALDAYDKYKGFLFAAGVIGAVASSLALARRRSKSAEAYPLYISTGIASAAVAWMTRPDSMRAAPRAPIPGQPSATARSLAWVDAEVSANSQQRPGWEAATWGRLANDLGQGTLSPSLQVFFTRNTR